jgi:hypothetical protein
MTKITQSEIIQTIISYYLLRFTIVERNAHVARTGGDPPFSLLGTNVPGPY